MYDITTLLTLHSYTEMHLHL